MANKTTKTVADTVKSTAEDMQGRFQSAFEKSSEMASEAVELTKGNVEALVESGKILASGLQEMGRDAVEDTKSAYETMTDDVKKLAAVSSPTEMFKLQGELARKNFDAAVAQTSKNSEKLMKLANDVFAPVSNRVSVTVEKLSKAA